MNGVGREKRGCMFVGGCGCGIFIGLEGGMVRGIGERGWINGLLG